MEHTPGRPIELSTASSVAASTTWADAYRLLRPAWKTICFGSRPCSVTAIFTDDYADGQPLVSWLVGSDSRSVGG